ncbi:hypothetical protein [Aeromicrobium sp. 179-A 4D2 NHS]|uniref:hypothetical protein n=1 Tax=Aeromicrobium sp. 179-A 4D2 NHS TaxID=3142375 RepID=UPI0039A195DA
MTSSANHPWVEFWILRVLELTANAFDNRTRGEGSTGGRGDWDSYLEREFAMPILASAAAIESLLNEADEVTGFRAPKSCACRGSHGASCHRSDRSEHRVLRHFEDVDQITYRQIETIRKARNAMVHSSGGNSLRAYQDLIHNKELLVELLSPIMNLLRAFVNHPDDVVAARFFGIYRRVNEQIRADNRIRVREETTDVGPELSFGRV